MQYMKKLWNDWYAQYKMNTAAFKNLLRIIGQNITMINYKESQQWMIKDTMYEETAAFIKW